MAGSLGLSLAGPRRYSGVVVDGAWIGVGSGSTANLRPRSGVRSPRGTATSPAVFSRAALSMPNHCGEVTRSHGHRFSAIRRTKLLGMDDGPDQIAAALNAPIPAASCGVAETAAIDAGIAGLPGLTRVNSQFTMKMVKPSTAGIEPRPR